MTLCRLVVGVWTRPHNVMGRKTRPSSLVKLLGDGDKSFNELRLDVAYRAALVVGIGPEFPFDVFLTR